MEPITNCRSPILSSAPPAASWTREEVNMIQEIFLSDDKTIQIQDISYSNSSPHDPLVVSIEQNTNATSMLLSPIGADNAVLQKLVVDEKEDTIDLLVAPFQNVPVTLNAGYVPSTVPNPNNGRPMEHILAKLRTKVEDLNHTYYSRCMNVSRADQLSINKMKLLLAIERLRRVIESLSLENNRLKTNTLSCAQHGKLRLQNRDDRLEMKHLSRYIDKRTCAVVVKEGIDVALNKYAMDGKVLMDREDEHGWSYKTVLTRDGSFAYSLKKDFPKELNMHDVIENTWNFVTEPENASREKYSFIKVQQVKKIDKDTIIVFDTTNRDATCVNRVVAVLFRVETPTGILLGLRSLDVGTSSDTVQYMECSAWQHYERKEDGGFFVKAGGLLSLPSSADVNFVAVEIFCLHWRWETSAVGIQLAM